VSSTFPYEEKKKVARPPYHVQEGSQLPARKRGNALQHDHRSCVSGKKKKTHMLSAKSRRSKREEKGARHTHRATQREKRRHAYSVAKLPRATRSRSNRRKKEIPFGSGGKESSSPPPSKKSLSQRLAKLSGKEKKLTLNSHVKGRKNYGAFSATGGRGSSSSGCKKRFVYQRQSLTLKEKKKKKKIFALCRKKRHAHRRRRGNPACLCSRSHRRTKKKKKCTSLSSPQKKKNCTSLSGREKKSVSVLKDSLTPKKKRKGKANSTRVRCDSKGKKEKVVGPIPL